MGRKQQVSHHQSLAFCPLWRHTGEGQPKLCLGARLQRHSPDSIPIMGLNAARWMPAGSAIQTVCVPQVLCQRVCTSGEAPPTLSPALNSTSCSFIAAVAGLTPRPAEISSEGRTAMEAVAGPARTAPLDIYLSGKCASRIKSHTGQQWIQCIRGPRELESQ